MTKEKGRKEGREEEDCRGDAKVPSSCGEAPSLFSLGFSVGPQAPCLSGGGVCGVGSVAPEGPGPSLPAWCTPGADGPPSGRGSFPLLPRDS